jgi:predicted small lipoprotein YifL
MVRPALGNRVVTSNYRPKASGWTIFCLSAAALALAGCGRKSGLDLPPYAPAPSVLAAPVDTEAEQANKPSVFNPYYGTEAPPAATKGPKKAFVLDPLLKD